MYSAQLNITKYKIEALADASIRSCFSEYCISLLDDYDLLYVDTSYKVSDGGTGSFLNHIAGYIEENMRTDGNSFYKITYKDAEILDCVFADENDFYSLKKQIRKYAYRKGMNLTNEDALDYYIFEKLSYKDNIKDYSVNEFEIEYILTGRFEELVVSDAGYYESLCEMLKSISYDTKIKRLVDVIDINEKENYSVYFDFRNLLESAEIKFHMAGGEKDYEITKKYSLK